MGGYLGQCRGDKAGPGPPAPPGLGRGAAQVAACPRPRSVATAFAPPPQLPGRFPTPALRPTRGPTAPAATTPTTPTAPATPPPPRPPPVPPTLITSLPEHLSPAALANGLLLVDKPPGWEVAEVLAAVQRATRAKKLASLAPLDGPASGLLLVAFGEATRLARAVEVAAKRYEGSVVLGAAAGGGDARGGSLVADAMPWGHVADEELQEVADSLVTGPGAGTGGAGGTTAAAAPLQPLQLLPLPLRLRQLPGSFTCIEEDIGPSMLTLGMELREFRVWRQAPGEEPLPGAVAQAPPSPPNLSATASGLGLRPPTGSSDPRAGGGAAATAAGAGWADADGGRVLRFSAVVAGRTQLRPLVTMYGRRLRSTAVLDGLRRTGVGSFGVGDAWALETLLPLLRRYRGWWSRRQAEGGRGRGRGAWDGQAGRQEEE
ncbi:hypothetical protein GPECTOR_9g439 [Gonium pectorale]|uniref:tRNA pseudouridine(55) synthase n=1 Tax=Gonium pectorale TaxID=33097 RepID=A0A150GRD1_GONPE|nr:hypothetical protein GPECTOR_9g439 [Gonium pectorale]|eukprot:KXZ52395.1 hypothetical protein GPECTOR_9g439 [Gonium pectorale]